jgi:hypothetical protein
MTSAGLFLLMMRFTLSTGHPPGRTKFMFFYWQTLSHGIVLSSRLH